MKRVITWLSPDDDKENTNVYKNIFVVTGLTTSGIITRGSKMMLGPDKKGEFKEVLIKSIHCRKVPVKEIWSGQIAAIALKLSEDTKEWIGSKKIRKGMYLVN